MESSATLPPQQRRAKTEDDGFATFYSSLTTGTMSKLSSVLAYAGLPLTAEESQQPEPAPKEKILKDRNNRTVSAANEPDVKKYFSKAALTAIEDEHRQRGAHGQVFGPAESFYVVQKGGGTYSYADIARNQQLHLCLHDRNALVHRRGPGFGNVRNLVWHGRLVYVEAV